MSLKIDLFKYKNNKICGFVFKLVGRAVDLVSGDYENLSCRGCGKSFSKTEHFYNFSEFNRGERHIVIHIVCAECSKPVTEGIQKAIHHGE